MPVWSVRPFLKSILSCRNWSDVLQTHCISTLDADFILAQQSQNFQIPAVMRVGPRLPCSDSFTNGFSRWCMFTKPSEQLTALSFEERWFFFLTTAFVLINAVFIPRWLAINSLSPCGSPVWDFWICCSYLWTSAFGEGQGCPMLRWQQSRLKLTTQQAN